MNPAAVQALADADWDVLSPRLQRFAHHVIARYRWRGLRVTASPEGRLAVGDMGPEDFVMQAVEKLGSDKRAYRSAIDLEANLKGVIESDIDNHRKKTGRRRITDRTASEAARNPSDPMDDIEDELAANGSPEGIELRRRQSELLAGLSRAVADDEELSLVLMAYEDGKFKTGDISEAVEIPAARVSELKRKLAQRAATFISHNPEFNDLPGMKAAI